jgi:hypothetical protein
MEEHHPMTDTTTTPRNRVLVAMGRESLRGVLLTDTAIDGMVQIAYAGRDNMTAWVPVGAVTRIKSFSVGDEAVTSCGHTYTVVATAYSQVVCDKGYKLAVYDANSLSYPSDAAVPADTDDDEDEDDGLPF